MLKDFLINAPHGFLCLSPIIFALTMLLKYIFSNEYSGLFYIGISTIVVMSGTSLYSWFRHKPPTEKELLDFDNIMKMYIKDTRLARIPEDKERLFKNRKNLPRKIPNPCPQCSSESVLKVPNKQINLVRYQCENGHWFD